LQIIAFYYKIKIKEKIMGEIKDCYKVKSGAKYGSSPIPEDNKWVQAKKIEDISGLSHGVGTCAPMQGACKLTINVKNGIIKEALIETIGCSGMTHSSAMAGEILVGKTLLEALNTDLVCDAINVAMKEVFMQLVYGRSQSAFSDGGLNVGTGMEDLGKYKMSQVSTVYSNSDMGPRYLELTEGYITHIALDENDEIIGYEYVNMGALMKDSKKDSNIDVKNYIKTFGRYTDGIKFIDPHEE
jgi:NifU-like protein involved in Fe-S cluster formation